MIRAFLLALAAAASSNEDYDRGVALRAAGSPEEARVAFWKASQAGVEGALELCIASFKDTGEEWAFYAHVAHLVADDAARKCGLLLKAADVARRARRRRGERGGGFAATAANECPDLGAHAILADLRVLLGDARTPVDRLLPLLARGDHAEALRLLPDLIATRRPGSPEELQLVSEEVHLRAKTVAWGDDPAAYLAYLDRYAAMARNFTSRADGVAQGALKVGFLHYLPSFSPELLLQVAFAEARAEVLIAASKWAAAPFEPPAPAADGKLRVGVVASRLRGSALSLLVRDVLAELAAFEDLKLTVYDVAPDGSDDGDPWYAKMRAAVGEEHWVRVRRDDDALAVVRGGRNDVLVDMDGRNNNDKRRSEVFALRSARAQVHVQEYMAPQTSLLVDYLYADDVAVPQYHARHFDEKLLYAPRGVGFFSNSHRGLYGAVDDEATQCPSAPRRSVAGAASLVMGEDEMEKRRLHGLPLACDLGPWCGAGYRPFVFASFNKFEKLSPGVVEAWATILLDAPGSVLWLLEFPRSGVDGARRALEGAADRVRQKREGSRGAPAGALDPARLIFGAFAPTDRENQARLPLIDACLDTWPYGAHTSSLDCLFAGVPVITARDGDLAGRVALSHLVALSDPPYEYDDGSSNDDDDDAGGGDEAPDAGTARLAAPRRHDIARHLAADGVDDYVRIAARHANDRPYHDRVRRLVERGRDRNGLFRSDLHAAALRDAFRLARCERVDGARVRLRGAPAAAAPAQAGPLAALGAALGRAFRRPGAAAAKRARRTRRLRFGARRPRARVRRPEERRVHGQVDAGASWQDVVVEGRESGASDGGEFFWDRDRNDAEDARAPK
ncbi:protein N-acetylglucosaminyltransferase [Aureococcus anophagefferens]|nr:protein N-acetylglucosaminyltransferase [Aureococcus anophagefferens]